MITEDAAISEEFINAKVRGMRSKLIEAERLTSLTDCRSLHELFRRLRPTETFEGHTPFQRELVESHVNALDRVRRFLSGPMSALFDRLMARFQLEDLKIVMRAHRAGMSLADVGPLLVPLPRDLALPFEMLFENPDPRRFVEAVPEPDWRPALAACLKPGEGGGLFECEMELDRAYWRNVMEAARGVDPRARRLAALDSAIHGALMILRARLVYDLDRDRIGPWIVRDGDYLTHRTADALLGVSSLSEGVDRLPTRMLPPGRDPLTLSDLEDALLLHQYRTAVRCFVESVLDVSVVIAFYYIKRAELSNLIRLSEGVRHALPRDEIESRLLLRTTT
jgi:vacuolar-type H+-ATPase subunit C/Vma6